MVQTETTPDVGSLTQDRSCALSFADPQSVTINAVAVSLPRVSSGVNTGTFSKDDGTVRMNVTHTYGKRNRRVVRIDHQKVSADPLMPATNVQQSMSVYLTVDAPKVGYTVAEQKQIIDALTGYLTASSGARTTQLLGGEN